MKDPLPRLKFVGHYSGPSSVPFWDMVNLIEDRDQHDRVYLLSCELQNLEGKVLKELKIALAGKPDETARKAARKAGRRFRKALHESR